MIAVFEPFAQRQDEWVSVYLSDVYFWQSLSSYTDSDVYKKYWHILNYLPFKNDFESNKRQNKKLPLFWNNNLILIE